LQKDKFIGVVDALDEALQADLCLYRLRYPAADNVRLHDLKSSIDLLTSIMFFRRKVLEDRQARRASEVVRECVTSCVQSTYSLLYENCSSLYCRQYGDTEQVTPGSNGDDDMRETHDATFWQRLIALIVSVVEEDRLTYANVINQ
jgi:protein unc-13